MDDETAPMTQAQVSEVIYVLFGGLMDLAGRERPFPAIEEAAVRNMRDYATDNLPALTEAINNPKTGEPMAEPKTHHLPAYPDSEFLLPSLTTIYDKVSGGTTDTATAVKAGWTLLGIGLATGLPDPDETPKLAVENKPAFIKSCIDCCDATGKQASVIPWGTWINLLLSLLQQWLTPKA